MIKNRKNWLGEEKGKEEKHQCIINASPVIKETELEEGRGIVEGEL